MSLVTQNSLFSNVGELLQIKRQRLVLSELRSHVGAYFVWGATHREDAGHACIAVGFDVQTKNQVGGNIFNLTISRTM